MTASVYMASVLEYLVAEVLELAGNCARCESVYQVAGPDSPIQVFQEAASVPPMYSADPPPRQGTVPADKGGHRASGRGQALHTPHAGAQGRPAREDLNQ